jgi:hypothetical protein
MREIVADTSERADDPMIIRTTGAGKRARKPGVSRFTPGEPKCAGAHPDAA